MDGVIVNVRMGCGSSQEVAPLKAAPKKGKKDDRPVLYIWPGSAPCRAVLMAIHAANVDVNVKILDIFKQEHKTEAFKKINPEGSIPTFVDGDLKMWESRPIMKTIVDKYTKGCKIYPEEIEVRCLVDKYLDFDKETSYPAVSDWIYPQVFAQMIPDSAKKAAVSEALDELNLLLSTQTFVAADHVTLADLSIIATLSLLELVDWDFTPWPDVDKWRGKMKDLEYYALSNKGLEDWKFYLHAKEMEKNEE